MNFEEIIGNNAVKNNLNEICKLNKIAHSYIFLGVQGIGKKIIAKEFAKKILCLNEQTGCRVCKSCIEFETENHPDFKIIIPDGKNIKIEQIREFQSKVYEKPVISSKKVYIIDDADLMTKEAQNCLLKTLEEPPAYVVIILIVSNESKLLNTIKSRCIKIVFSDLNKNELKQFLKDENIDNKILERANGSIKKLIHIKENKELYEEIEEDFFNIDKKTLLDFLKSSEIISKNKEIISEILDYINLIFYEKATNNSDFINNKKYTNCIQIVEETKQMLKQNGNFDMCIDYLFFKIWEEELKK